MVAYYKSVHKNNDLYAHFVVNWRNIRVVDDLLAPNFYELVISSEFQFE